MKRLTYLLLAFTLFIVACGDDERTSQFTLNHDGSNDNSPNLPEDIYEAATQFSASQVAEYAGLPLMEVEVYMYDSPLSTTLKIYGAGDGNRPGDLLYEGDLTGNIRNNNWTTHVLSEPLILTGEELWISVRLRHARTLQSIGCDQGPSVDGGDWFYQESDKVWRPFQVFSGEDINWNIRGIVQEQ